MQFYIDTWTVATVNILCVNFDALHAFFTVSAAQCPVDLRDAMLGVSTSVRTLDDRALRIEARHVTPDTVKLFPGEGMPNSKVCTHVPSNIK